MVAQDTAERDAKGRRVGGRVGGWIRRRPFVTAAIVVAALGLAVFVFAYFEPHKLFIDDRVSEAAPAEQGTVLAEGAFEGIAHGTTGTAQVLELADGSRVLRFEDLATDNGPDLRVYLSTAPAGSEGDAYAQDFVDLGELKGNLGSQNYTLPADVDLSRYRSVVIWCVRFSVGFGVAPLQ
ncbi:MAG: DM13 domain-containing protein [Actinobacteria bacterium]|nr:DM13 domain-containing protein [Actinomycetota bacterium]